MAQNRFAKQNLNEQKRFWLRRLLYNLLGNAWKKYIKAKSGWYFSEKKENGISLKETRKG